MGSLYDAHAPLLYSVLLQMLEDVGEAQDVLHDVFVTLPDKAGNYDPSQGQPVSWLITICRRRAIDLIRRRAVHRRYLDSATIELAAQFTPPEGPHGDEIALLHNCLGSLSDTQRQMLTMAYFSGMTQQEISEKLVEPLGTVKARIRRGLIKLRNCIEGLS